MEPTVKTTIVCSNCGAPIDFKVLSEKCPYCDSPYAESVLSQMRTEREIQRREIEYKRYQMKKLKEQAERVQAEKERQEKSKREQERYEQELVRLSKLPKVSTFLNLDMFLGAFGAHWIFVKCWFKAFLCCASTIGATLAYASGNRFLEGVLLWYIIISSTLTYIYAPNNCFVKSEGVEFNVNLWLKPKKPNQKYYSYKGLIPRVLFSAFNRMFWIPFILALLNS